MPNTIDTQACYYLALSGDEQERNTIVQQNREISEKYSRNKNEFQNLQPEQQKQLREQYLEELKTIRDDTVYPVDGEGLYLCAYFGNGEPSAEHFWIEDHTNGFTFDTFPSIKNAVIINGFGRDGEDFKPGCEGRALPGQNIVRVNVDGYTQGQMDILTNYTRSKETQEGIKTYMENVIQGLDDKYRHLSSYENFKREFPNSTRVESNPAYKVGQRNNGVPGVRELALENRIDRERMQNLLTETIKANGKPQPNRFEDKKLEQHVLTVMQNLKNAANIVPLVVNESEVVNEELGQAEQVLPQPQEVRSIGQQVCDTIYQHRGQIAVSVASGLALFGLYRSVNSNSNTQTNEPPAPKPNL